MWEVSDVKFFLFLFYETGREVTRVSECVFVFYKSDENRAGGCLKDFSNKIEKWGL